jgi:hypothetical protein
MNRVILRTEELQYLMTLYRFTLAKYDWSIKDPILQALQALVQADHMHTFAKSKTLIAIYEYFREVLEIPPLNLYCTQKLNEMNTKAYSKWIIKLQSWNDQAILDLAEELNFRRRSNLSIDKMPSKALIAFVAEALIEDRSYQLHAEQFRNQYQALIYEGMEKLLKSGEQDLYAWYNYQDNIESHHVCTSARRLEAILDGEVSTIADVLDGKHSHLSFKGSKKDFSDSVKLFLALR